MNIIINGFHHSKQIEIIDWIMKQYCTKNLIYICDPRYPYLNYKEDIYVDNLLFHKVAHGMYDLNNCEPLDEEMIEKMSLYEPICLKMMDRLEYYVKRAYTYHDRKILYLNHLRYWNDLIKKKKIDLYIGSNIPHEIYDYVIYGLTRIYNITTYFFLQSQINDLIHPISDWEKNCKSIHAEYLKLSDNKGSFSFDPNVEQEWRIKTSNVIPFYMKPVDMFTRLKLFMKLNSLKNYVHPSYYRYQFKRDINRLIDNRRLKREYSKIATTPNLTSKYFYVALHYQPEMTTSPIGGAYVDQFLIVEMLDKHLPSDVKIYIKEHPKQEITSRTFSYYKNILENKKRIYFVPLATNTYKLIENSIAVVTASGSVGWEALFRKKPVLLFGHNFYQYAPCVFSIKTNTDCKMAIETIMNNQINYNENNLKCFIQASYNCSIKGIIDPAYEEVSNIGIKESNKNIFNWIKQNIFVNS